MAARLRLTPLCIVLPVFTISAQSVVGTVTERSSGLPVRGAGIVLMDAAGKTRAAVLADSNGAYRITAPSPGVYRVSVQRLGLSTANSDRLTLRADQVAVFDASLSLEPKALPAVVVSDKAIVHAPPGNPHKYDEFIRRKELGFGHFITRDEIDSKPQYDTRTLFSGIAGVKFWINGTEWYLRSQRCGGGMSPGHGRPDQPIELDTKADPLIFVDGIQVPRKHGVEMLREISPQQIEALEVYQGASEMPAEAKGDACFAIFIWLR
jgi:hypothetical protein